MQSSMAGFVRDMARSSRIVLITVVQALTVSLALTTPAEAIVRRVDKDSTAVIPTGESWTLAYKFLNDALTDAQIGDQIWLADGEYRPDKDLSVLNPELFFRFKKDVAMYGGFQGISHPDGPETEDQLSDRRPDLYFSILTGDLADNDDYDETGTPDGFLAGNYSTLAENSIHVCAALSTPAIVSPPTDAVLIDLDTRLDGVWVVGGNANDDTFLYEEGVRGAGLFCGGADIAGNPDKDIDIKSSPTIAGSRFAFNHAGNSSNNGYAAAIYTSYGDPVLRDLCVLANNHSENCAGATVIEFNGDFTALACTYQDNRAGRNSAAHQSRGGSHITKFHSCKFINNKVPATGEKAGALLIIGTSGIYNELTNCEFRGNSAPSEGGAVRVQNTIITNCTFSGNRTNPNLLDEPPDPPGGGGVYANFNVVLRNCILWDNISTSGSTLEKQIYGASSTAYTAEYSDIQTGTGDPSVVPGTANINENPAFRSASDLHLTNCSPAIDKALDSHMPQDSFDIDNDGVTVTGDPDGAEATPDADTHDRILDGDGVADEDENEIDMGAYEFDLSCLADLYADNTVNGMDLAILLADWTGAGNYSSCPPYDASDLSGPDCKVNGADLAVLLGQWGACPEACGSESMMGGGEEEDEGTIDQLVAWFLAGDMAAIIQWLIEQGY